MMPRISCLCRCTNWSSGFVRYCRPAFPTKLSKYWWSRWHRHAGCPWSSTSLQNSQFFHISCENIGKSRRRIVIVLRMTGENGRPRNGLRSVFASRASLTALTMVLNSPMKWQRDTAQFWLRDRAITAGPRHPSLPVSRAQEKGRTKVRPGMKVKTSRGERAGRMGGNIRRTAHMGQQR